MADTKTTALTALTAPAGEDLLYTVDDPSGTPTSKKITVANLGRANLEINNQTVTTTDITGAVNQFYICTIAELTAHRNLTLPSATAGDRIGVYIVDGDADYALILKGAASQTINGGTAATEWSRLFIKGESAIFKCTAANTWIVENDRRIPCVARMELSTAITTNSAATWTVLTHDTAVVNIGQMCDTGTNSIVLRRDATVVISAQMATNDSSKIADQDSVITGADDGSAGPMDPVSTRRLTTAHVSAKAANNPTIVAATITSLNAGDKVRQCFWTTQANAGVLASSSGYTFLSVAEILES